MVRMLCRQKPRAIVFSRAKISLEAVEEFRRYQESGGILVSYGYQKVDVQCDQVEFSTEQNSYLAAKKLIDLGHKKIGFRVHGYRVEGEPRVRGYERALREHGLEIRDEWLFRGPLYEEGGARLAQEYLAMKDRPTGLCIVNDNSAWVFVNEIIKAGLRVPEDVSVIGHDDTAPARFCFVPLTTARYPVDEIVETTTSMLLSRLNGTYNGPGRHVKFDGSVVERASAGAPPRTDS
jgi:DNA-binding LacI/PurR family transcriptional regulator